MAGLGFGPGEEPPDLNRSGLPSYCRSAQNDGVLRVYQLRVRTNEDGYVSDDEQRMPKRKSLPSNPFLIGNSIKNAIGFGNAKHVQAIKEARGAMYTLRTYSPEAAAKLEKMTALMDQTPVEVVPHPTLSVTQGVVIDHDTIDMSESELLNELSPQGVTAVRRIKKRDEKYRDTFKNTPTLVLSFRSTTLPAYVNFGLLRVRTRPYYPSPLICRNCAAYGHTLKRCDSSAPICMTCSEFHPLENDQRCQRPKCCKHCKGDHPPTSRDCPVFQKEEAVIRLKVNRGITFQEARAEINSTWNRETYASKVQQRLNPTCTDDKDKIIKTLQEELDKMRKVITDLQKQLSSNGTQASCSKPSNPDATAGSDQASNSSSSQQANHNETNSQSQTQLSPGGTDRRNSRKDMQPQNRRNNPKTDNLNKEPPTSPPTPNETPNRSISKKRNLNSPRQKHGKLKKANSRHNQTPNYVYSSETE